MITARCVSYIMQPNITTKPSSSSLRARWPERKNTVHRRRLSNKNDVQLYVFAIVLNGLWPLDHKRAG